MLKPEKVPDAPVSNGNGRIDTRVEQFIFIRGEIEEMKEQHKKQLAPLELLKQRLIGELLEILAKAGQTGAKTANGTVSIIVRHTASCSDPDAFIDFVRENDAYELIDRRANVTACRDYADEHGALPPGVKISSIRTIGVTRA